MFYFDEIKGKKILKSTMLEDYDCFFTTRDFVITPADRIDLIETSKSNHILLKNELNPSRIITAKQTHSSNVRVINDTTDYYDNTDALISKIENTLMILNFADCVPIILYSKKDNIGAVIHAGWRGTASHITKETIKKINEELNINPKDITALIGPSIGKCCFETGEEVFEQLIKTKDDENLFKKVENKYFVDLKLLNKKQLVDSGVENIDVCDYCTCCMSDIFFSYRKEKGITARHSAIVKIKRG